MGAAVVSDLCGGDCEPLGFGLQLRSKVDAHVIVLEAEAAAFLHDERPEHEERFKPVRLRKRAISEYVVQSLRSDALVEQRKDRTDPVRRKRPVRVEACT